MSPLRKSFHAFVSLAVLVFASPATFAVDEPDYCEVTALGTAIDLVLGSTTLTPDSNGNYTYSAQVRITWDCGYMGEDNDHCFVWSTALRWAQVGGCLSPDWNTIFLFEDIATFDEVCASTALDVLWCPDGLPIAPPDPPEPPSSPEDPGGYAKFFGESETMPCAGSYAVICTYTLSNIQPKTLVALQFHAGNGALMPTTGHSMGHLIDCAVDKLTLSFTTPDENGNPWQHPECEG